ncbi:MAG: hypothetical protein MUE52_07520 [Tabrizicola sp.]|jgi:hypothetical protein|nr:hypothetical protein [Tabrizicola sp.]
MTTVDPNARPTTTTPTASETTPTADDLFKNAVSQAIFEQGKTIYQMGQSNISIAQSVEAEEE